MDDAEARLKDLMLRGLDGDAVAYRQCLALLSERMRVYFTRRMSGVPADIEDLVQETLLAVHIRRASYDRARPLSVWAHAIARYKLIDHWRRRRVRMAVPLDDVADFLAGADVTSDDGLDLTRALSTLPERQRKLVETVKVGGDSIADAGAKLGMTEGAAKVALHRALKRLAEGLRHAD